MSVVRLSLPTANPEGLAKGDLIEYASATPYRAARGERGIIDSIAADAREAPVLVTFETSGERRCWPIELRRVARAVAS